jgi:hypothetical protein
MSAARTGLPSQAMLVLLSGRDLTTDESPLVEYPRAAMRLVRVP